MSDTPQHEAFNISFEALLRESGYDCQRSDVWAVVDRGLADQGWKLHLSSIPIDAAELLLRVLPIFDRWHVGFKVAHSTRVLEQLNAGELGESQVGKFITVYPSPEDAVAIAQALSEATSDLKGPKVPSDIALSKVVYARYGPFRGRLRRDRLGNLQRVLKGAGGSEHFDSYLQANHLALDIAVPFPTATQQGLGPGEINVEIQRRGYRLLEPLKHGAKGTTFVALDLRAQKEVRAVVVKQARAHAMSDRFGRDARSRLRREHQAHHSLWKRTPVAQPIDLFDVGDDTYLVLEFIEAQSIEQVVFEALGHRPWSRAGAAERTRLLHVVASLAEAVAAVHACGFVHRDLSNSNVVVDSTTQTIRLLDLEMAQAVDDRQPQIGSGTEGFSSPEQARGLKPSFADDVFALASLVLLTITGIDPRRFRLRQQAALARQLVEVTGEADELRELIDLTATALCVEPAQRPAAVLFKVAAEHALAEANVPKSPRKGCSSQTADADDRAVQLLAVATEALRTWAPRDDRGLWLSPPFGTSEQSLRLGRLEVMRSAHTGAAGVAFVASRLVNAGRGDPELETAVRRAAEWLLEAAATPDSDLPGLFFGKAGVAVALRQISDMPSASEGLRQRARSAIVKGLAGPLDWPDLTHGAAGQGVASLICEDQFAQKCADYLVSTQTPDGAWVMPAGVVGVSGRRLTGFGHGVAGISYFLAAQCHANKSLEVEAAWRRGLAWLDSQIVRTAEGWAEWPYSDALPDRWRWWCHGAPGISLAYLKAYETTGERRFMDVARGALSILPEHPRHGNLGFCHGLSGLGEIFLEAYRVTGDDYWIGRAAQVVASVAAMVQPGAGAFDWTVDNLVLRTADLGGGIAGIAHFLLRFVERRAGISMPFLL